MDILVKAAGDCLRVRSQGFSRAHVFEPSTTGDDAISLELVWLARGAESSPHSHLGSSTVIYTLAGAVTVFYGERLEHEVKVGPADCVYIPPGVVHYVVNEGDEAMTAVVARTPARHTVEEFANILPERLRPTAFAQNEE